MKKKVKQKFTWYSEFMYLNIFQEHRNFKRVVRIWEQNAWYVSQFLNEFISVT